MGLNEAIVEAFGKCATGPSSTGTPVINDFTAVVKVLWPILDNNVSLCDLSGIFTISAPSRTDGALDIKLFTEFLTALAKIKYPTVVSPIERLLKEIINAKSVHFGSDSALFAKLIDKQVVRVLLKFDLPLRRAFCAFAGNESMARVGGNLNWEDVKNKNIGMEMQGFTNFCGSYSMIPDMLSSQQCVLLAKDVANRFPTLVSQERPNVLLYPQFQLLLALAAATISSTKSGGRSSAGGTAVSGPKVKMFTAAPAQDPKRLADSLSDLLKNIGVNVLPNNGGGAWLIEENKSRPQSPLGRDDAPHAWSAVAMPITDQPQDMYSSLGRPGGEAAMLRIQHAFSAVARMLQQDRADLHAYNDNSFSRTLTAMQRNSSGLGEVSFPAPEEVDDPEDVFVSLPPIVWDTDPSAAIEDEPTLFDSRTQLVVKPIVVGDAVPPPLDCPLPVLHLLEAALAHHNLGSYEEALKFLEAARSTMIELTQMQLEEKRRKAQKAKNVSLSVSATEKQGADVISMASPKVENNVPVDPILGINIPQSGIFETQESVEVKVVTIPIDIEMYINVCMGNIYQSSGDDEQALAQYHKGWVKAKDVNEMDWAAVCLNSLGLVAYYNLRYELAYQAFVSVADYRAKEYGVRSVDTASAWNNQGCCLFGMSKHTEARLSFEQAFHVLDSVLGPRHPRTTVVWNNVEKAKRSLGIKMHIKDMKESITIRPDSTRLLIGSKYLIKALPPPAKKKKAGKAKKGGGKKRK